MHSEGGRRGAWFRGVGIGLLNGMAGPYYGATVQQSLFVAEQGTREGKGERCVGLFLTLVDSFAMAHLGAHTHAEMCVCCHQS